MPDELDSFLKDGTQPREGVQEPAQPVAEKPSPDAASAESKPAATPAEPAAKAADTKPDPEPDEDHGLPVTGGDNRTVPFSALEKVRNDWKSKYAAEQARAELLAKQLEEAKRPPPAPAAAPQPVVAQLPDFNADPRGFIQGALIQQQQAMLNERLNTSEHLLREKLGDDKVTEYQRDFQQFAEKDPTLFPKLYAQAMPYQWLAKEIDRRRMQADIGDDPAAYEAKLRAKWEQEMAASTAGNGHATTAAPRNALPPQPPSLAGTRSVAGRTAPGFTGPPPLTDLFPGVENRRRAR